MSLRVKQGRGILPIVLIAGIAGYWWMHSHRSKDYPVAYVSQGNITLWNALVQVRQPVAELHYGDRVEIVSRKGDTVRVRTAGGKLGWLPNSHEILNSALWHKAADLLARAKALPIQARGQTRTVTNVRIGPGISGKRIFQFVSGIPVVVLARAVVNKPVAHAHAGAESAGAENQAANMSARPEDWLLVLTSGGKGHGLETTSAGPGNDLALNPASANPVTGGPPINYDELESPVAPPAPIAGWVLGRFVQLNPPAAVENYAASSDFDIIAWFALNHVPDGSGGKVSQYLVAGSRGGEGQPCDFSLLRVYTWSAARQQYETAYMEDDLCGRLPIRVSRTAAGPEFRFKETGPDSGERRYILRHTLVRRIRNDASQTRGKR